MPRPPSSLPASVVLAFGAAALFVSPFACAQGYVGSGLPAGPLVTAADSTSTTSGLTAGPGSGAGGATTTSTSTTTGTNTTSSASLSTTTSGNGGSTNNTTTTGNGGSTTNGNGGAFTTTTNSSPASTTTGNGGAFTTTTTTSGTGGSSSACDVGGGSQTNCDNCVQCADSSLCASQESDCDLDCGCYALEECISIEGCTDSTCDEECVLASGAEQSDIDLYNALNMCLGCSCQTSCEVTSGC